MPQYQSQQQAQGTTVTVTVQDTDGTAQAGLNVYAFTLTGTDHNATYSGYAATTDGNGQAVFSLPDGSYSFRADLNGTQFWSDLQASCTVPDCTSAAVTVTKPLTVTALRHSRRKLRATGLPHLNHGAIP